MSCGACATRYFLSVEGIGGIVLLCPYTKGGSLVGFVFFAHPRRLSLWLRFFKLIFSWIFNLFSCFAGFFDGPHACLHV